MKRLDKVFRNLGRRRLLQSRHSLARSSPVAKGKRDLIEDCRACSGIKTVTISAEGKFFPAIIPRGRLSFRCQVFHKRECGTEQRERL